MHEHLEIIMPHTTDIEAAVKQIMEPFSENGEDNAHPFWDFYVIGGRWSGEKIICTLDKTNLDKFYAALKEINITVSGVQCGKQKLEPISQEELVNNLWCKYFPESAQKVCPLFAHFNDQYKNSAYYPDVMKLGGIPANLTAARVIIAGPHSDDDIGGYEAKTMMETSYWNGVSRLNSEWDGKISTALENHAEGLKNAKSEYKLTHVPDEDWLVVTVDYHS